MDYKNLIGRKVLHKAVIASKSFGEGVIDAVEGEKIVVDFNGEKKGFGIDDFCNHFRFIDDETKELIQQAIDEIKDDRAKVEAARKAAEEAKKAAEAAAAKKAQIVAGFNKGYNAKYLNLDDVYTYEEVEAQFGIQIHGFGRGINPTENTVVLISSIGGNANNFVYHDKWDTNGDYIYSGEGKTGDQKMNGGNLEIKDAAQNGKVIHLFVKFSPQEYYYQGIFELVDYTYEDDKDEEGNVRKEYKFRLRKVSGT